MKYKRGLGWFLFLNTITISSVLFSQDSLDTKTIISFPEYLTFRMGIGNTYNSFGVIDKNNDLSYAVIPNADIKTTFTLLYRSLEIDFGFAPGFLNPSTTNNVDSDLLVFNFRMYLGQWMQTFDFYNINGFELKETNFEVPDSALQLFENFNVLKMGGSTGYILNKNFSFRAISFQNEWQQKSSGSLIPRVSYYFTRLKDVSPERDDFYDITAGPSYYYNWVIAKHIILSAGVKAGIGLNVSTIKNSPNDNDDTFIGINYSLGGRVALGYNSKQLFFGMNSNFDYFEHGSNNGLFIEDRQNLFEFYVGYRLKAPNKWNEFADRFNKKIGWE